MTSTMPGIIIKDGVEYQLPSATARLVVRTSQELGINLTVYQGQNDFTNRYRQGEKLGGGGFGNVFKGKCIKNNYDVVIKEVNTNKVPCWCALDNILVPIEVVLLQMCQKVSGVVRMLDVFNLGGTWVIIMNGISEFVCDMFDFICELGSINELDASFLMHQLVGILIQCHRAGVLHRDIKDENLLIDRKTNEIMLIDFGSGAFLHKDIYTDFDGTRVYCPPEWITHNQYYGKPAEVWSLGVLLYDMICGDVPFVNDKGIVSGRLKYRKEGLSEEAKHLIGCCMNRDALKRPNLLEILRHPWMQRCRPKMSSTLPHSILISFETLMNNSIIPSQISFSPSMSGIDQLSKLKSTSIKIPTNVRHENSDHQTKLSTSPTNLTHSYSSTYFNKPFEMNCSFSPGVLDLSIGGRLINPVSNHPCIFNELQTVSRNALEQSNLVLRTHSNRSYASSGYYSRSNSLSSADGKSRAGAFAISNMVNSDINPTNNPPLVTCTSEGLKDWRKDTNELDSSSSNSSTSSAVSDLYNKTMVYNPLIPTSCQSTISPAFRPTSSTCCSLTSPQLFSSVSCNNLSYTNYRKTGEIGHVTPDLSNFSAETTVVDIPMNQQSQFDFADSSLWFRCFDPLGVPISFTSKQSTNPLSVKTETVRNSGLRQDPFCPHNIIPVYYHQSSASS